MKLNLLLKALYAACLFLFLNTYLYADIKIGVLSHRGDEITLKTWASLTTYLNESLDEYSFNIIPLDFDQVEPSVSSKSIDFLIVNPGIYVAMEVKHRVSRLVTLNKVANDKLLNVFGGVIFTQKNRNDINDIEDIVGKRFIAVDSTSLGGYQMVWRELNQLGIEPMSDFKKISFAGTHDKVVMAIKNGEYDIGTVRTGIIEQMARSGDIKLDDFKIINSFNETDFPFHLSTRLYPEWPFSKLNHTSNELAQQVAIALLNMSEDYGDIEMDGYLGWTVPLDYQDVHDLFSVLNLPPYESKKSFTLFDAILKYWQWLVVVSIFVVIVLLMSLRIYKLNHRLEESKFNLEQQHGLVLNSVCDGIYGVDLEGNCTFINRAMETLTGWASSDIIGKQQHLILHHSYDDGSPHPINECPVYQTFRDNMPRFIKDDVFWKKDGEKIPVEYSSTPIKNQLNQTIGSVVVFRDISEKKKNEERVREYQADLAHVSRLNTLGGMVTGLAHELNQPLTAIATNAYASIQLIESGHPNNTQLIDILEMINQHAERAGNIIRHLRTLSKKDIPKRTQVSINQLVNGVLDLLSPEINRLKIKLELALDASVKPLYCQAIQIDQVILNLCKNSIESLADNKNNNRHLIIRTQQLVTDYIAVSIEDNGRGIDPDLSSELFEPFVSSQDDGMGLGLSICNNIIEAHNGHLYLSSTDINASQESNTIFTFELPQHDRENS